MLPDTTSVYAYLQRPSMVDYPGHLSAVLFTSGCNFACGFCHNAELLQRKRKGLAAEKLRDAIERFRQRDWIDAVVLTGGEPTLCSDLPEIIDFLRDQGLVVKLDSNGSHPEVLQDVIPVVDAVAMDVKCSLGSYPELARFRDTDAIGESVQLIMRAAKDYEFRTTVIDSFHTDEEMRAIGQLINGAETYVLQPFLPHEDLPDPKLRAEPRTSPDRLRYLEQLMHAYAEHVSVKGQMAETPT